MTSHLSKPLYLVTASHAGACVFGGHWIAASPAEAKALAIDAIERGRPVCAAAGLPPLPPTSTLILAARRSRANPAAFAMNGAAQ